MRYKAWGESRYTYGTTPTKRQYTGQVSEIATIGLYFYGARFYDPVLSRFTSADSIIPGAGQVQAWDRYAAMGNNPIKYIDPTGHAQACADGDEGGGCGRGTNALDVADYYARMRQEEGTTTYWAGLPGHHQNLLEKGGWNEGQFADQVSAATTPADTWHDPLTYLLIAVGAGGSIKAGVDIFTSTTIGTTVVSSEEGIQKGVTVLGRWPVYLHVANDVGGTALNDPDMANMTTEEAWAVNQAFLDAAVARGDYFYLASNWAKAEAGSFFARELNYLFTVYNYTIAPGRPWLIPPDQ